MGMLLVLAVFAVTVAVGNGVNISQQGQMQGTSSPTPTVQIAPGVFMPVLQLGACTDCATKAVCCGSDIAASLPLWAEAQRGGVVGIDTQLRYNDTEIVARSLSKLHLPRERLWITTKIDPKVFCDATDPKATALAMARENLRQLNVSYVDLLLLHEPCNRKGLPHPSDQLAWAALQEAKQNGWTRAIGVDRYAPAQIDALKGTKPAVLMASMSMAAHDDATMAYAHAHGIHYNAFGIMHGCKFSDNAVTSLAAKYKATPSQICGTWTRQRGCTMAVGVGVDPAKMNGYIHEDLNIFSFNMTAAEMDTLNNLQSTAHRVTTA